MVPYFYFQTKLLDMEKEYEENERQLKNLSAELEKLNCEMQIHLEIIQVELFWGCCFQSSSFA